MDWARIAANLHYNPKVRKAGADGREVFLYLLLRNADDQKFSGTIKAAFVDVGYMAEALQRRRSIVSRGLAACIRVQLVVMTQCGDCSLVGFDDTWVPHHRTSRERVAKWREKTREISRVGVTKSNDETLIRVEESRVDAVTSAVTDPVTPDGSTGVLLEVEPMAQFNLEAIYADYPRKVGKREGLKRLRSSGLTGVQSAADYELLKRALQRYRAHVADEVSRGDLKFVKHFGTWTSSWREWAESSEPSQTETVLDNFRRKILEGG